MSKHCKVPCKECPFNKDTFFRLGLVRAEEIVKSKSFVCHKTTNERKIDRKQCAGFMHLIPENEFQKVADFYNINTDLRNREAVFENVEDFLKHHAQDY